MDCFACEKPLTPGQRVWWHKKYEEAAAFHEACRTPHKDYDLIFLEGVTRNYLWICALCDGCTEWEDRADEDGKVTKVCLRCEAKENQ